MERDRWVITSLPKLRNWVPKLLGGVWASQGETFPISRDYYLQSKLSSSSLVQTSWSFDFCHWSRLSHSPASPWEDLPHNYQHSETIVISRYTNQMFPTPALRWNRVFRGAARYTFFRLSELLLNASELERSGLSGYIHQGPSLVSRGRGVSLGPFQ